MFKWNNIVSKRLQEMILYVQIPSSLSCFSIPQLNAVTKQYY